MVKINSKRRFISLKKNDYAVLGLPMRITVGLILGMVVMGFVVAYILNPCLFPNKMIVTIDKLAEPITGNVGDAVDFDLTFNVNVKDKDGYPVEKANVVIKGLGGIADDLTDKNGNVPINIKGTIEAGIYEGYLDVNIKAPCFETFSQNDMIKLYKE